MGELQKRVGAAPWPRFAAGTFSVSQSEIGLQTEPHADTRITWQFIKSPPGFDRTLLFTAYLAGNGSVGFTSGEVQRSCVGWC
jgi:hypothetical protein